MAAGRGPPGDGRGGGLQQIDREVKIFPDADRAVRTVIAMLRELSAWNHTRILSGKLPVDIGIGLNTDNVVSGNIGSKKRMDYTIIGDGGGQQ